jgi:thymidylate synthase
MNKLDKQYTDLLQDILDNGVTKQDRTGTGTISVFGRQIRHDMKDGFPLLTTKKMPFKTIVTELLWFLRGDTNIKYLVDNNCHIWNGDAYKNWCKQFEVDPNNFNGEEVAKGHNGYPILDHVKPTSKEYKRGQINVYLEGKAERPFFYLTQEEFINKIKTDDEFAKHWGELGPVYGKQWRSWKSNRKDTSIESDNYMEFKQIDQIQNLINDLKTNPDSRRLMINAWNVGEIDQMVLPPCHYGFQVYTRELSVKERLSYFEEFFDCTSNSENMNEHEIHIELSKSNIPTRSISLMFNMRSVDTFLGLPFNIASYGLLLEIIAKEVNMVPDELIGNLGDTHLYLNHIEQAKEQIGREMTNEERNEWCLINQCGGNIRDCKTDWKDFELDQQNVPKRTREPYPLPTVYVRDGTFCSSYGDVILENYQSHPPIKAPLSN